MVNKKGVSEIVGYVLLIAIGIILAVIAYSYLKTYVPRNASECPSGVSLFIKEYSCSENSINITLKNNGRFNVDGFYIHAANTTAQRVATINLVKNFKGSSTGNSMIIENTYILINSGNITQSFPPAEEVTYYFELPYPVKIIEITPLRFQNYTSSKRITSCGKSVTREEIEC